MNKPESNQANETPALKFVEIYQSSEWQMLNPIDRAQLIMVAENVKPGTIIGGGYTLFQRIVEKMGLKIEMTSEPMMLNPVYGVARPGVFEELEKGLGEPYRKLIMGLFEGGEFHQLNGRFLGYPECCTEEYNQPKKNLEARKKKSPHKFLSNVDYEMSELIEATGTYPGELDYCPPAFTPCGAKCENALRVLGEWKRVVEAADPIAAKELRVFNRRGTPAEKVHQNEVERKEDELEWHIQRLRKSILEAR